MAKLSLTEIKVKFFWKVKKFDQELPRGIFPDKAREAVISWKECLLEQRKNLGGKRTFIAHIGIPNYNLKKAYAICHTQAHTHKV